MPNHPDIPDLTALQRNANADANTAPRQPHLRRVLLIYLPSLLLILPFHIWAACSLSWPTLLEIYFTLFRGVMKGLATGILCAGIILPPTGLAYWVWERLHEEVVF